MARTLTFHEADTLCRDSLQLAAAVERCGGPPPERAAEFYRGLGALQEVRQALDAGGLGFGPLALIPWLLFGAAAVAGAATVPALIAESRRVVGAIGSGTASVVGTVSRVTNLALYAGLALGGYWATRQVLRA